MAASKKTASPAKKTAPAAKKAAAPVAKKAAAPVAKKAAASVAKKAAAPAAEKKAFARMTAKVSPLAGMELEPYIAAKAPGWQGEAIRTLAALTLSIAAKASMAIKWGQPVFSENGPMIFMKPNKAHLTFGFWRGGEMADPKGVLEGDGDRMKHVKIRSLADIDTKVLRPLVEQAVRLNREKGDPTRRG